MSEYTGKEHLPVMPRWPKPHLIFRNNSWMVVFTHPRYPHTRYFTGAMSTIRAAWEHLPVVKAFHGVPQ